MPWGNRPSPDDQPIEPCFGRKACPRCGKIITINAWGRRSHMESCLRRSVTIGKVTYPPAIKKKRS